MKKTAILLCTLLVSIIARVQLEKLRPQIEAIISGQRATIGVALIGANGDTLTINNNHEYPTLSVYKFPLAIAVLSKVDDGTLSLEQKVLVKKSDLLPNTYSPLRDEYPDGNFDISLAELLRYTVALSDNNGCDMLFRLVGGTAAVDKYIKGLGIEGVSIQTTEEEMHRDWKTQYTNTSTPLAAVQLLEMFHTKDILSPESRAFLWKTITGRSTGMNKLKGLLPNGTVAGHKSGMSYRNESGLRAADNDIGIIILPNGQHFSLAVFINNSTEEDKTNVATIANIAKLVWDYYAAGS